MQKFYKIGKSKSQKKNEWQQNTNESNEKKINAEKQIKYIWHICRSIAFPILNKFAVKRNEMQIDFAFINET